MWCINFFLKTKKISWENESYGKEYKERKILFHFILGIVWDYSTVTELDKHSKLSFLVVVNFSRTTVKTETNIKEKWNIWIGFITIGPAQTTHCLFIYD